MKERKSGRNSFVRTVHIYTIALTLNTEDIKHFPEIGWIFETKVFIPRVVDNFHILCFVCTFPPSFFRSCCR